MIFDKALIKADFNKAANSYDDYAQLQRQVADELLCIASNYLSNGLMLDIGCGTGYLAKNSDYDFIQIDLAEQMCIKSQEFAAVTAADMEALPFAQGAFSGVISSLALQWAVKPQEVFAQAYRVLADDSYAIFATFAPATLKELKQLFEIVVGSQHVSSFLPINIFENIASRAGFEVVSSKNQMIELYYPDLMSLLKSIKKIGASNKQADRSRYFSKSLLREIEKAYWQGYGTENGIKASWEITYLILKK